MQFMMQVLDDSIFQMKMFVQWIIYYFFTHRQSLNLWTLYFGRQTQAGPNPNEVAGSVSRIIVHPNYNNTRYNNDLALMKLTSPLTFTLYISPICLASSSSQFFNSTSCWATGWGKVSANGEVKTHFVGFGAGQNQTHFKCVFHSDPASFLGTARGSDSNHWKQSV